MAPADIPQHLANLKLQCPEADEYGREIHNALFNWTSGVPHGLIIYRVESGLDAWRKTYNKYMPLAHDLKNLFTRES